MTDRIEFESSDDSIEVVSISVSSGRPLSLGSNNRLEVELPEDYIQALWDMADKKGVPASSLVERALLFYLSHTEAVESYASDEEEG
jgi:hypothetical protein